MNLIYRLAELFRGKPVHPEPRLTVLNITRNSELGHSITVADRGATRRKGLLDRQSLGLGEGLWIIPCEAIHTFGMKFSIDVIYLDRHGCVRKVGANVRPCRLSACFSAHSVMEFASGTISRTQTAPGDKLVFSRAPAEHVQ